MSETGVRGEAMGKKCRKKLSRYVNCSCKGAISLFMAVLMTPFLSIAMLLVETGRYNSSVSILEEAMGVSSTSTLANYDKYLHERWGLMAVDQGININSKYRENLSANAGIMGDSIKLGTVKASGDYDLADSEVLYRQIMEYCKLNAPTMLGMNFANISQILKQLDEKFNNIGKLFSGIASGVDTVDSVITLVESVEKLKKSAGELDSLKSKYNSSYNNFENAVKELQAALAEPVPKLSDYEIPPEITYIGAEKPKPRYDTAAYRRAVERRENRISSAKRAVNYAKTTYAGVIGKIIDNATEFKEGMKECLEAAESIGDNLKSTAENIKDYTEKPSEEKETLDKLQDDIKKMESGAEFNPTNSTYLKMKEWEQALSEKVSSQHTSEQCQEALKDGLDTVYSEYNRVFQDYSDSSFEWRIDKFKELKSTIERFNAENVTRSAPTISQGGYQSVKIQGYITAEEIKNYMEAQEKELIQGELKGIMEGLTAFMDSIVKMSSFYNPDFSAIINTEYYKTKFGSMPGGTSAGGGALAVVKDIGEFIASVGSFAKSVGGFKLIKALKSLKGILESVSSLVQNIIQFAFNIGRNIVETLTNYERLYYSTYTTFNLPCRTDTEGSSVSFETMTGYSLERGSLCDNTGTGVLRMIDGLKIIIDIIDSYAKGTGKDFTFYGAELEYILFGSNSEVANQLYTFCVLYLLRLLLDVVPVTGNMEVQSLAVASMFGYPVVMAIEILAEPLVDTLLLVNGEEIELLKKSIYLTPSGLPGLLEDFVSVLKFTPDQKENLKSSMVNAFGAADDDYNYNYTLASKQNGKSKEPEKKKSENKAWKEYKSSLLNFNYREYCFIILLLTVTKEEQIARLQNLIQMETLYHYEKEEASYTFDLRKSHTYLKTEVSANIKQMLPSLADSSLFSIKREQYRGY